MLKKFKKGLAVAVCLGIVMLTVFSLAACGTSNLKSLSENISVYTIDIVYNDEAKTAAVKQTVNYINNYDIELNDVYFHLYPAAFREGARFKPYYERQQEIDKAFPNGMSYGGIEITKLVVGGQNQTPVIDGQDNDILIADLQHPLMPTQRVKIEMEYTLTIPNMRHRFGYHNKTVNFGNFYPIACVYENGSFETSPYYFNGDPFYSEIANYNVSITAPEKFTAAMSGIGAVTELGNGNNRTFAASSCMRDFSIILGEFDTIGESVDGIGVKYSYYDDLDPAGSLKAAADSIRTFNSLFGKYPYASITVVQTGFLHGGMEYPGLVYISDLETGEIYRDVIVHEIAHQWWYAVVGNNQIEHAWLDETLAEYSATLFYEKNPSYNIEYSKRISDALAGYILFCDIFELDPDTSMSRSLPEFRVPAEYTFMTYTKGQIMMDTLRKTLGDKSFFAALKSYYEKNFLKIATPDHLIAAFERESKKELKSFFDLWTEGKVYLYGA